MSPSIRQWIRPGAARAGVRPGTRMPAQTTPAASQPTAQTTATDKKLAQIVEQGGVGVWKATGSDTPIYALTSEQAAQEAQRRHVEGRLSLTGYVKLSEQERATLTAQAAKPMTAHDREVAARVKEEQRRSWKNESSDTGPPPSTSSSPKTSAKSQGFTPEDIAYIESVGGKVGVVSEAEAARMEAASKSDTSTTKRDVVYDAFTGQEIPRTTTAAAKFAGVKATAQAGPQDMTKVKPSPTVAKAGILSGLLLLPYRNKDGTYNLQRMVEGGKLSVDNMRSAGFSDAQIGAAIDAAMKDSAVKATREITGGMAVFDEPAGKATASTRDETIDPSRAKPASRGIKSVAVRALLLPFQNNDRTYNLERMVESNKVSVATMRAAGFTDAQVMAAVNAAMKDSPAAKATATGTLPEMTQQQRVDRLGEIMQSINAKVSRDIAAQAGEKRDIIRESERTHVALPGEKTWYDWRTGQTVSDEEYRKATDNGRNSDAEFYSRSAPEVRRQAVTAVSSLFFLPVRAALPEVEESDITRMDYLIGGAQLASWLAPFAPKGTSALQAGAGAIFGINTAQNWGEMSTAGRTISVAASALLLTSGLNGLVQPSFKPVKVPLKDGGEAVVWSGLSARGKPLVGVTKLPPNIKNIAEGWRPLTKTETSVLGTRKMLTQMGVSKAEIDKVLTTVKETKAFQGMRSPYEPENVSVAEVAPQALTPDELSVVLQRLVKNKGDVQMVYGSTTIKPQLAPELRGWRQLGDIEAQLKVGVTEQQAAKLARDMVTDLNKTSPGKFSIDPADAKRIIVNGHHAVELKLAEVSEVGVGVNYSLTRTGEMSWGMKVPEKPITVNYPGVGKLKIMRLSESGVRKADAITRAAEGGTFAPPAHRVKDIADYYVILRTFKGADVADDWARLYGYDSAALLKQAAKDPLRLDAWEFSPGGGSKAGAPSVSITLPPDLAKVAKGSPEIYSAITKPVPSASLAPSLAARTSPSAQIASVPATAYASPVSPTTSAQVAVAEAVSEPVSPASSADASGSAKASPPSESSAEVSPPAQIVPEGSPPADDVKKKEAPPASTTKAATSTAPSGSSGGLPPIGGSSGGYAGPGRGSTDEAVKRKSAALQDGTHRLEDTGEVQWKQGKWWIKVTPPAVEGERFTNVQYSRRPFWGVRKVKGTPEQTFAWRGNPPKKFLYEMGVTSIDIHSRETPHLRYRQLRKAPRRKRGRVI